jgi:hypothetical protein
MADSLTPNMVLALSAAAPLKHTHGLERRRGGWASDVGQFEHHSFTTVHALVDRGYLSLWANGTVAHITYLGELMLAEWRERQALRQQRQSLALRRRHG